MIAAVDEPECLDQGWLRLERDNASAEASKRGNAIADVGTDVEHQRARTHEARVETVHRRVAFAIAIVDAERANDGTSGAKRIEHGRLVTSMTGARRSREAPAHAATLARRSLPASVRCRDTPE